MEQVAAGSGNDMEEEERDMIAEEEQILKDFQKNDEQMDELTHTIVAELKKVKNNALNIDKAIEEQGTMLQKQNEQADKIIDNLTIQSNDLKEAINKHKSGKQCCFDLFLLFFFLGLLSIQLKMLQHKGYIWT